MAREIKAILFDSGRVLNGPSTGHWFISPNFFTIVDKEKFNATDRKLIAKAFNKANAYMSKQNLIRDEQEEYYHFLEFYRIFSNELPQLNLSEESIKLMTSDLVGNYGKYSFFDDAIELIPKLNQTYKLAVVSDAWPSLNNVFKEVGLRNYFSSFIISSELGVTKPHELMYKKALEELVLSPSEVVFVDDSIRNCDGARKLGIQSILLCRDWKLYWYYKFTCKRHPVVRNIKGVIKNLKVTQRGR